MVSVETLEWVLGILLPLLVTSTAAAAKFRADSQGFKLSYEREKQAGDEARQEIRDAKMAADIASKTAEALHKLSGGGA